MRLRRNTPRGKPRSTSSRTRPAVVGSHDDHVPTNPPPWGRRRRDRLPLLLLAVLAVTNIIVGLYLVLVDPVELALAPAWAGALALMPDGDPAPFGGGLIVAAGSLPFAFARRVHVTVPGWVGLGLGGVSWGALAGSFAYVSFTLGGIGTMSAAAAAAFCVLHLGVLFLERR